MIELALKEAASAIRDLTKHRFSQSGKTATLSSDEAELETALARHLEFVESWSSQVNMVGLAESRPLAEIAVEPRLILGRQVTDSSSILDLLDTGRNSVLLAPPGAGKSTTVKLLCQRLLHHEPMMNREPRCPVLVRLRDLRADEGLIDHLGVALGIRIDFSSSGEGDRWTTAEKSNVRLHSVLSHLNSVGALVLLDGLDEVGLDRSAEVRREIRELSYWTRNFAFVLTCREGALETVFDNTRQFSLAAFDDGDLFEFCSNWFVDRDEALLFLSAARASPYADTLRRPLVLANLCLVYQASGELPEPPVVVYQRTVQLLLEDWDRQRDLKRVSRYGRFGPERKRQFLGSLSFELSRRGAGASFDPQSLLESYRAIYRQFDLPLEDRGRVISEVQSHSGLIVEAELGHVEFSHKSIQEFLCADHVSRMVRLQAHLDDIAQMPNEMAIATVLSASPNEFFSTLVRGLVSGPPAARRPSSSSFWSAYLSRLEVEQASFGSSREFIAAYLALAASLWQPESSSIEPLSMRLADGASFLAHALEKFASFSALERAFGRVGHDFFITEQSEKFVAIAQRTVADAPDLIGLPTDFVVAKSHLPNHTDLTL